MTDSRVFRYCIPVDDQWHDFNLTGGIVHVGARWVDTVEFWSVHVEGAPGRTERLRVFGIGHQIVDGEHVGTVIAPGGQLVWHLFRKVPS